MWIRTSACALGLLATLAAPGATAALETTPAAAGQGLPVGFMPRAETSFGAEILDGWLYVLGGYHGVPHDYSREGQSSAFYRLNLHDPRHVELLPDVEPVQGAVLVRHGDALVSVGGMRILNAQGEPTQMESVASCALWDSHERSWQSLPELPAPRSSHQAEVVGDTLVVVGGWRLSGGQRSNDWHDTWLTLDLAAARAGEDVRWQSHPAPFKRRAQAMASVDGQLVVIGGFDGETGKPDGRSWRLDVSDGSWSDVPAIPGQGFAAGFAVSAAEWNGQLVASGQDGQVHQLGEDGWTALGHWTYPRFFHELVSDGEALYTLGGIGSMDGSQRLSHVERFEVEPATGPRSLAFTVPAPGAARNRQGMALVGQRLFLFGGHDGPGQHDFGPEEFLDEGWVFDLGDHSWSPLARYPARRQSMSAVHDGASRRLLMLGGFGVEGSEHLEAVTHADVHAFELDMEYWSPVGELPVSRSQFGAFLDEAGDLWVLGGLDYDPMRDEGDEFRHLTEVVHGSFGDDGLVWHESTLELPEARRAFGGTYHEGKYYMVGGMREGFTLVEDCHVFDPATGAFEIIPSPSRARISPELVAVDGKLVLVGGSSRNEAADGFEADLSIEVYDPAVGEWSLLTEAVDMPTLKHARAFAFNGKLLIASTHLDDGRLDLRLMDVSVPASAETVPEFARR